MSGQFQGSSAQADHRLLAAPIGVQNSSPHGRPGRWNIAAPMATLSTHALDTMHGCPAAGMAVALYSVGSESVSLLHRSVLNDDGRAPDLAQAASALAAGRYRLVFQVAAYFRLRGAVLPDPPFLDEVGIDFGIGEAGGHYHVPLLASPWAYSTYRGS